MGHLGPQDLFEFFFSVIFSFWHFWPTKKQILIIGHSEMTSVGIWEKTIFVDFFCIFDPHNLGQFLAILANKKCKFWSLVIARAKILQCWSLDTSKWLLGGILGQKHFWVLVAVLFSVLAYKKCIEHFGPTKYANFGHGRATNDLFIFIFLRGGAFWTKWQSFANHTIRSIVTTSPTLCQITKHCCQANRKEFLCVSVILSPYLYVLVVQGLRYSLRKYWYR